MQHGALGNRGHAVPLAHDDDGARAAPVRAAAAAGLGFLSVVLDEGLNAKAVPEVDVAAPESTVPVLVIEAREDVEIARQVHEVLQA